MAPAPGETLIAIAAPTKASHRSNCTKCSMPGKRFFVSVGRSATIEAMTSFAMSRIDLRGRVLTAAELRAALPRGGVDVDAVFPPSARSSTMWHYGARPPRWNTARHSTASVPTRFECPWPNSTPPWSGWMPRFAPPREVAIDRTRAVHADQRRTDTTTLFDSGAAVTERWVPVERVGLYVPGGTAVYPSSAW